MLFHALWSVTAAALYSQWPDLRVFSADLLSMATVLSTVALSPQPEAEFFTRINAEQAKEEEELLCSNRIEIGFGLRLKEEEFKLEYSSIPR